jgi:hypothetical protein
MTNHPNRKRDAKLPADVYYTPISGGIYVRWNGRPEGQVSITHSKAVAYGLIDENGMDDDGFGWQGTPYQGESGRCRLAEVIRLAAEYAR